MIIINGKAVVKQLKPILPIKKINSDLLRKAVYILYVYIDDEGL